MRALLYDRYGDAGVLRLGEVAKPVLAKRDVLVRVSRAALNPKDAIFRRGKFRRVSGKTFPKRCGCDVAGVVAESRSPHFAVGQRVFGCLQEWTFARGTLADFALCHDNEVAVLPDSVAFDVGAAIALAGLTALQALRDVAKVQRGQRILINGASGGVGTAALQIARIFGADVHSLSSSANQSFCAELGAQHAWSYAEEAWKQAAPFDVIFRCLRKSSLRKSRASSRIARRFREHHPQRRENRARLAHAFLTKTRTARRHPPAPR